MLGLLNELFRMGLEPVRLTVGFADHGASTYHRSEIDHVLLPPSCCHSGHPRHPTLVLEFPHGPLKSLNVEKFFVAFWND